MKDFEFFFTRKYVLLGDLETGQFSEKMTKKRKYREKGNSRVKELRWLNTGHTDVERSYLSNTTVNIVWPSFLLFLFATGGLAIYRAYVYYHRFCHADTCPLE